MELIKVGEKTYYIKNPTNIGIYKISENEVFLIDAGNDKDAGKKILKIVEEQGWKIKGIISTHSNADHIGGNRLIQDRTGCTVLANGMEKSLTEFPMLEPSYLYGGYPFSDLKNKFLLAKESCVTEIDGNLPKGLEYFSLKGHFFDMIGIKTDDDVYFLADSLFSEETINKYHVCVMYDVKAFLDTLDYLSLLKGKVYIPSHSPATDDISDLISLNREEAYAVADRVYSLCESESTFENILKGIFDYYGLTMNAVQYVLIGSTVKSYLSYLYESGRITFEFKENVMYWKQK